MAAGLGEMVGSSAAMQRLYAQLQRLAPATVPILIRGESGTGKELVARTIHELSPRRGAPFVAVNCATLPQALLESELFGHIRGSFTGASTSRQGLFVEASSGTLFLDEIGDMPAELQAKLLRVLQERAVRPVGSDRTRTVDVRIVAATHQPLEARVDAGAFRADLFYRLNVVPLRLPPLRRRPEDIPALLDTFLARVRAENPDATVERFTPQLVAALARRPWPGNVRELENAVRRIVILSPDPEADTDALSWLDEHDEGDLPEPAPEAGHAPPVEGIPVPSVLSEVRPLRDVAADYIEQVLHLCGGNKTKAAELLGINVSTIHRRRKRD